MVAGIVALAALKERHGEPQRTLAVVSLVEEEASRFSTANFWSSRAIIGHIQTEEPNRLRGYDGVTMAEAMRNVDLDPAHVTDAQRDDLGVFIELHIEQGPFWSRRGCQSGSSSASPATGGISSRWKEQPTMPERRR